MSKETCIRVKRDLFVTNKTYNRDLRLMIFPGPNSAQHTSKETYIRVKRNLFVTKVTYNRDLRLMISLGPNSAPPAPV